MRDIDEQMDIILQKAEVIKEKKQREKYITGFGLAIAACVALMVTASLFIVKVNSVSTVSEASRYGSLIISAPYMGYVIIGLISFILGLLVTLLCVKLRELKKMG